MDKLLELLKGIAPTLATAVAGPLGGVAVAAIAKKLGVEGTVESITQAIAGDPAAAAKLAEIDAEQFRVEQNNVTDRWEADMQGDSWLSKNIRPMALLLILGAYFLFAMMSAFGLNAQESYVQLLGQWGMLVMSAYFGGRTLEKIMEMKHQGDSK